MDSLRSRFRPQTEIAACAGPFSAETGGLHYSWRGRGPAEKTATVGVYDPKTEQWTLQPTTGPITAPSGLYSGGCVALDNHLYCFGGESSESSSGSHQMHNDLHRLNLTTFQWSNVHLGSAQRVSSLPMQKAICGFVVVNERTLGCFGGWGPGIAPFQPGSRFLKDEGVYGWTNEFHLFDVQTGMIQERNVWYFNSKLLDS